MTAVLSALFLVVGAVICLIASVGVLRLPDFFLRMHAATKAGVVGAGLVLIGVAFAEPSPAMWIKVALAIAFLLLTTPIAGHLLARAAYVAGVPLWGGTREDRLEGELRRGDFDRPAAAGAGRVVRQVVLGLAHGPGMAAAIEQGIRLARTHGAKLIGLAIVDTRMLENVGPVPLGGTHYAAQLRQARIGRARHAMAETIQSFEHAAQLAEVSFSVLVEEGDPVSILRDRQGKDVLLMFSRQAWFDHGVVDGKVDPARRLARRGIGPVICVSREVGEIRVVDFVHDGSERADRTWRWLLDLDPWPVALLRLSGDPSGTDGALSLAGQRGRRAEKAGPENAPAGSGGCEVLVLGNGARVRRPIWSGRKQGRGDDAPIIVFG